MQLNHAPPKSRNRQLEQAKLLTWTACPCCYCDWTFPTVWQLVQHMEQGHVLDLFPCWLCDMRLRSGRGMVQHLLQRHLGCEKGGKDCRTCGLAFNSWLAPKSHICPGIQRGTSGDQTAPTNDWASILEDHDPEARIKVSLVSQDKSSERRQNHRGRQKVQLVKQIELETGYTCRVCDTQFQLFEPLMEHFREEHPAEHQFTCHICSHSGSSSNALKIHLINQHSQEHAFARCVYCPMMFVRKKELTNHVKDRHAQLEKLVCRICGIAAESELELGKKLTYITYCLMYSTVLQQARIFLSWL